MTARRSGSTPAPESETESVSSTLPSRVQQYGFNVLTPPPQPSFLWLFAKQLVAGFNFILWLAALFIALSWKPLGSLNDEIPMIVNLYVAIILVIVILLLFQPLMKKFGPKSEPAPERSTPAQTAQAPAPAPPAEVSTPPAAVSSSKTKPAAPVAIKQASAEAETVVENDRYKITFTNKGAQVKSWILKDHVNEHGQPLDLVHSAGAQKYGYPPTQRVINFILKDQFASKTLEGQYGQPFKGGTSTVGGEGTTLNIAGNNRLNFDLKVNHTSPLTEAERGIVQSIASTVPGDPDEAAYRNYDADPEHNVHRATLVERSEQLARVQYALPD